MRTRTCEWNGKRPRGTGCTPERSSGAGLRRQSTPETLTNKNKKQTPRRIRHGLPCLLRYITVQPLQKIINITRLYANDRRTAERTPQKRTMPHTRVSVTTSHR